MSFKSPTSERRGKADIVIHGRRTHLDEGERKMSGAVPNSLNWNLYTGETQMGGPKGLSASGGSRQKGRPAAEKLDQRRCKCTSGSGPRESESRQREHKREPTHSWTLGLSVKRLRPGRDKHMENRGWVMVRPELHNE